MSATRIFLNEVCLRDGLQMEPVFVETDDKVRLADALSHAGVRKIEVTSFASARAIPALRDAEAVLGRIERVPGVTYSGLVLNARGAERALSCRLDELNLVLSASRTHSICNTRMTTEQARRALHGIVDMARPHCALHLSIATAFGCPMEGAVERERVLALGDEFAALGVSGISLCDTTGMANPKQVRALCEGLEQRWQGVQVTLHLHDTRGMGLANVLAGIAAGVRSFDASLGGLGGCPYAPGASGNVCTEDLAHMLGEMGYDTGVDLQRLLECAAVLRDLVGHEVPGQLLKSGPSGRRFPVPDDYPAWETAALARAPAGLRIG
jgi:hydroxymethylglutaryl-CoA lyase